MPSTPALPCSVIGPSCAAHERPAGSTPVTSKRLVVKVPGERSRADCSPLPGCAVWFVTSGGLCRVRTMRLVTGAVGCRRVFQIGGQPECLSERPQICPRGHIGRAFIRPWHIAAPRKSKSRPPHVETPDGQWLHTGNTHDQAGDRGAAIRAAVAAGDSIGLEV